MAGIEWLLELALVLLLSATLFYALRLQRALKSLRGDRTELQNLIDGLAKSTGDANTSIARLHTAANGVGRELARHSAEAASLKDDLTFLTERAERLADRLAERLNEGRRVAPSCDGDIHSEDRAPATAPPAAHAPEIQVKSEAERELLRALKLAR